MKQHSIIALILLSVISLGCAKEIPNQVGNNVTLTTTVSLSGTPASKALTAEGVKTFAPGEQVAIVYTNTAEATVRAVCQPLTDADIHDNGKTATFTVTLTDPKPSGAVRYIYPAAMAAADGSVNYAALFAQDGTLASLSAAYDLALFEGALTADAALPNKVSLDNPLTIGEFTVSDGTSDITSSIVSFTVSAGTDTYTVNRAAAAGPIYVAMKPVSGDFSFTAFDGALVYEKAVTGKTMAAGSMYPVGISMTETFNALATPLTFEAIEAGAKVSFKLPSNTEEGAVQYRVNGGTWTNYNTSKTPITLENVGDKVQFRGNRNTYYVNTSTYDYGQFSASDDCYLYGNIMSLVTDYTTDEHAFASNVTLTGESTFFRLFENNIDNKTTTIRSSDTKPLVLPAMQLADCCYQEMFYNCTDLTAAPALPATQLADGCYMYMFCRCTDLTAAPALPATQLADYCYLGMFGGCTALTAAPALPATQLAEHCYEYMFYDCTALTAAPALPATQLADYCYQDMFGECTALTAAPALPATQLAEGCYQDMFGECTALTAAPALPATQLADYCYQNMFGGCTALTAAPALPATQLANQCYQHMFYECINLCSVTCLATDFMNATDCTMDWLDDVAENGTFYKAAGTFWEPGSSGIPYGWDVVTVTP
jgi:hypothetical protein